MNKMIRLKELRAEKGLKQSELAKIFNVNQSIISDWENEKKETDYKTLGKIADYFGVSVDYLIGHTDELGNPFTEADSYTPEEKHVITMLRQLPPDMIGLTVGVIEAIIRIEKQRKEQKAKDEFKKKLAKIKTVAPEPDEVEYLNKPIDPDTIPWEKIEKSLNNQSENK